MDDTNQAQWGSNIRLGEQVVIEADVVIGNNVTIGNFVVIKQGTVIGDDVEIGDLTVLGKRPVSSRKMARKPKQTLAPLMIGNGVKIGCNCVIYCDVELAEDVLVGDLASIREDVRVGSGSIVGRQVTIEPHTVIGERVTIQTGCYITADMVIEDEVFLGPCISSANDKYMGAGNYQHRGPVIKRAAKIGNHATLLPGVTIGEGAVVGAGAVVTRDVSANQTVVGNPAKPLQSRKDLA